MKKLILTACAFVCISLLAPHSVQAQEKKKKQAKVIESKPSEKEDEKVAGLSRGKNDKANPLSKDRGPVYGDNYSDIVVDNYTGLYITIYVDGRDAGTVGPYGKRTTWSVPGKTELYAVAYYDDGSRSTWGPVYPTTDWIYTWNLRP